MNPHLHRLEVGKPYHPVRKVWPECLTFDARGGGLELIWFVRSPRPDEIAAVKAGAADLAIYLDEPAGLIVVCSRFGPAPGRTTGLPWSNAPYSCRLTPEAERTAFPAPEDLGPEDRALLQILLVDSATGILRAIRAVTLSPEFTGVLYAAIRKQAAAPFRSAEYDASLRRLDRDHASADLAASAAVSCRGGD